MRGQILLIGLALKYVVHVFGGWCSRTYVDLSIILKCLLYNTTYGKFFIFGRCSIIKPKTKTQSYSEFVDLYLLSKALYIAPIMYNSNISIHPIVEPNAPWLIPQDESRESSLYLLEQEEKEYNSKLRLIASQPASVPIGFRASTSHNGSNGGSSRSLNGSNHGGVGSGLNSSMTQGLSPIPRYEGGIISRINAAAGRSSSTHRQHGIGIGVASSSSSSSSSQYRRRSGSMRTYTPRASPHYNYHARSSSFSSTTMITNPVIASSINETANTPHNDETRRTSSNYYGMTEPSRIRRIGSGIGNVRSHEDDSDDV